MIDEDQVEKELTGALSKAKKLKERKIMASAPEKVSKRHLCVIGKKREDIFVQKNKIGRN